MSLWVVRILFLSLCTLAGYAVSQVQQGLVENSFYGIAIGFGLGNLALSHFTYGGMIAWILVSVGALLKAIVHSRLVKLQH